MTNTQFLENVYANSQTYYTKMIEGNYNPVRIQLARKRMEEDKMELDAHRLHRWAVDALHPFIGELVASVDPLEGIPQHDESDYFGAGWGQS